MLFKIWEALIMILLILWVKLKMTDGQKQSLLLICPVGLGSCHGGSKGYSTRL